MVLTLRPLADQRWTSGAWILVLDLRSWLKEYRRIFRVWVRTGRRSGYAYYTCRCSFYWGFPPLVEQGYHLTHSLKPYTDIKSLFIYHKKNLICTNKNNIFWRIRILYKITLANIHFCFIEMFPFIYKESIKHVVTTHVYP